MGPYITLHDTVPQVNLAVRMSVQRQMKDVTRAGINLLFVSFAWNGAKRMPISTEWESEGRAGRAGVWVGYESVTDGCF